MKKTVALIWIEGGEEEILRQTLEYFGYLVLSYKIGRPQHFIDILAGNTSITFDYVIICCHGEDGEISTMPKLGEDIYFPDEPRGNFGSKEIEKYLSLKDTCIINTGCTTGGCEEMVKAFAKNNNTYIAPNDYIEGDSGLTFVILFFYYLCSNIHGFDIESAYTKASSLDSETNLYVLRK